MWSWLRSWGLCAPNEPKDASPLAPPESVTDQGPPAQDSGTALPLTRANGSAEALDSSTPAAGERKQPAQDEQTPPEQVVVAANGPQAGRYIVSASGVPVGIANTVSKYRETQPVVAHLTPFEQRVAAKLTEEQRIAAAAAAAGGPLPTAAAAAAVGCDSSTDTSSQGNVAQELFADAATAAGSSST